MLLCKNADSRCAVQQKYASVALDCPQHSLCCRGQSAGVRAGLHPEPRSICPAANPNMALLSRFCFALHSPHDVVVLRYNRTTFGKDVATGQKVTGADYHTTGPTDSWGWRNKMPPLIQDSCMVEGKFLPANPWAALAAE